MLPVLLPGPWCQGRDRVCREAQGLPWPHGDRRWPWGTPACQGLAEGQDVQDKEPDSAGLALLCSRVCRQGSALGWLCQDTLPVPGHDWGHTEASTGQEQGVTALPLLFRVIAEVPVNQSRDIRGLTSHRRSFVVPCLPSPPSAGRCSLSFSSHSSSVQQLCPAHSKL